MNGSCEINRDWRVAEVSVFEILLVPLYHCKISPSSWVTRKEMARSYTSRRATSAYQLRERVHFVILRMNLEGFMNAPRMTVMCDLD